MLYIHDINNIKTKKRFNDIKTDFHNGFIDLVNSFSLNDNNKTNLLNWVLSIKNLNNEITQYFNNQNSTKYHFLLIKNEKTNQIIIMISKTNSSHGYIGEKESILSYIRSYNLGDNFLCSDCYGQMACSSCAVSIISGSIKNPIAREEELDMFDLDNSKKQQGMRLSCQAILKEKEPLAIKIFK